MYTIFHRGIRYRRRHHQCRRRCHQRRRCRCHQRRRCRSRSRLCGHRIRSRSLWESDDERRKVSLKDPFCRGCRRTTNLPGKYAATLRHPLRQRRRRRYNDRKTGSNLHLSRLLHFCGHYVISRHSITALKVETGPLPKPVMLRRTQHRWRVTKSTF
jgi:hypothetical protein